MSALQRIRRIARHVQDRGASAVEYGLMVAAIAAIIVGVVFGLGTLVRGAFSKTCTAIAAPATVAADCDGTPVSGS